MTPENVLRAVWEPVERGTHAWVNSIAQDQNMVVIHNQIVLIKLILFGSRLLGLYLSIWVLILPSNKTVN